jgi:hypothetical protein
LAEITPCQDNTVILRLSDGEITRGKIAFADTEYEDIVFDLIRTNRPGTYCECDAVYTLAIADLIAVEEVSGPISE